MEFPVNEKSGLRCGMSAIEEDTAKFLAAGGEVTKIAEAKVPPGRKASEGSIEESAERNAEYEIGDTDE